MSRGYLSSSRLEALVVQLSERDRRIIELLAQLHLLSGQQLRQVSFAGVGNGRHEGQLARRALLRLTRLDLLMRLTRRIGGVRAGSEGFVYRLSPGGQRLARWLQGEADGRARPRPEPGERYLGHRLRVSELYVRLAEAARREELELLEYQAEPECWRSFVGAGARRAVLKPDAFVRIGVGEHELRWFVEVDRGTVSQRTRAAQAAAYRAYWRSGAAGPVMPRVLWLGDGPAVVEAAETALQPALPPKGLFVAAGFDAATWVASGADPGRRDQGLAS